MKKLIIILAISCAPLYAQGSHCNDCAGPIITPTGAAVGFPTIQVCLGSTTSITSCPALAATYYNLQLNNPSPNPLKTPQVDAYGNYDFYLAPGDYSFIVSGVGIATKTFTDIVVGPNALDTATLTWAQSALLPTVTATQALGSSLLTWNAFLNNTTSYGTFNVNGTINIAPNSANLQPVYNVKQYGATGSGYPTSDLTNINAAITAACTAGGGSIYFPATSSGSYYVGTGVILSCGNLILYGDVPGTSHVTCLQGAGNSCFTVNGFNNVTIRDLEIDGLGVSAGQVNCPVIVSNASRIHVQNNFIHDGGNCNVLVENGSTHVWVEDNTLGNIWGTGDANIQCGIGSTTNSLYVTIARNHINETNTAFVTPIIIDLNGCNLSTVADNILNIAGSFAGIQIEATNANNDSDVASHNIITGTAGSSGLTVIASNAKTSSNISIVGNTGNGAPFYIQDAGGAGGSVLANITLSGNTLENVGGMGCLGIIRNVATTFSGININGNGLYNCGSSGHGAIQATNAVTFTMTGNTMYNGPAGSIGVGQSGPVAQITWYSNDTSGQPAGPTNNFATLVGGPIFAQSTPTGSCNNGTTIMNTAGTTLNGTFYVCINGTWSNP